MILAAIGVNPLTTTSRSAIKPVRVNPARPDGRRPFFPGMALLAIAIAATAFIPEYIANAAGHFPIAWILHIHGAIMFACLSTFLVQAWLGATGRTQLHRKIGNYGFAIGALAWVSMIFVEWRALFVYPPPDDLSEYDWMLPGLYVYSTFLTFLIWSYRKRNRPDWHKRLITFALFLSLQAAIQRYTWLPPHHGYWPFAALLDIFLLIPLFASDLRVLKGRLHPATLGGTLLLLFAQGALFTLWGTAPWRHFAFFVAHLVYR